MSSRFLDFSLLTAALLLCGACGTTAGSTPVTLDDASSTDSQISGTDAAADALPDTVQDAAPDVAPDVLPDGGPDTAADIPTVACAPVYSGSVPGATLDLSGTPCSFSISAAKGHFPLGYAIHVTSAEKVSIPGPNGCNPQLLAEHGGLAFNEEVAGGTQKWCLCDVGLCQVVKPPFTPTLPGNYTIAFDWDGNNWYGPSDTGNKPGPAFTAGNYVYTVSIKGEHQKGDGNTEAFSATASLPITLTP